MSANKVPHFMQNMCMVERTPEYILYAPKEGELLLYRWTDPENSTTFHEVISAVTYSHIVDGGQAIYTFYRADDTEMVDCFADDDSLDTAFRTVANPFA